jgi:hypothetical protein
MADDFLRWRKAPSPEVLPYRALVAYDDQAPLAEVFVSRRGEVCCIRRRRRAIEPLVWEGALDGTPQTWATLAGAERIEPFAFTGDRLFVAANGGILCLRRDSTDLILETSAPLIEPSLSPDGRAIAWIEGEGAGPLCHCSVSEARVTRTFLERTKCFRFVWRSESELTGVWLEGDEDSPTHLRIAETAVGGASRSVGTTHRLITHVGCSRGGVVAFGSSAWLGSDRKTARLMEGLEQGWARDGQSSGIWLWQRPRDPHCVANEGSRGRMVVGDSSLAFLRSVVQYPEAEIVLASLTETYSLKCDTYVLHFTVDWDAMALIAVAPVDDRWAVARVPISVARLP